MNTKVTNTTTATTATKEPSVSDLSEQLAILRDDMSALTTTLADLMHSKGQKVTEKAKAKAEAAKSTAQATAEDALDYAVEAQREIEAMVRRNPGTTLAVVAGLGFLFGLMTSRR